jgi:N-acyl homoserine lactone hydrolase
MFKRLHAFHCGTEICNQTLFTPGRAEPGAKRSMPYFFYLIEHTKCLVAFDTGPHPSLVRDNVKYLGPAASSWQISFQPGDEAASQLASAGFKPGNVTDVLMSHLHYDHAGGMCQFPKSRFWIQQREWDFANNPPPEQANNYVKSEFHLEGASINLVEGEIDVFHDGSLLLVPTPGHTPGHQSLLIRGNETAYLLTADASYLSDLDDNDCIPGPAFIWSEPAMFASRARLRKLRDELDATVISTHDPYMKAEADRHVVYE